MSSLTDLGCALATYGGLSYLVSLSFWSWWVVSNKTWFYQWGMYYLCTLLFINIKRKDTLQYSSLHSRDLVSILLSIFPMCACENYLSSKIYFLWFLLILEILFIYGIKALLHGIQVKGFSSSIELRSTSSLLSLSEEELVRIFRHLGVS